MTSILKKAVVVAGAVTLAATIAAAAIGWRSYKTTGSVIPPRIRRAIDECAAAELCVGGCPVFSYRASRPGDDDEL